MVFMHSKCDYLFTFRCECKDICIAITRSHFLSLIKNFQCDHFVNARHIIVDEAQNFRNEEGENWLKSIFMILKWVTNFEENRDRSSLFIFFDYLQKIRCEDCGLSLANVPIYTKCELNCVIRNSKKIYKEWERIAKESDVQQELPAMIRKNQPTIAHDYDGRDVNYVSLKSYNENRIFGTVKEIINEVLSKSYQASDVAVLFTNMDISKRFQKYIEPDIPAVTNAEAFPRESLVVDSFRRFCGLEAPVVIGVDPRSTSYENPDQVKILLYSRAMVELYIIT